MSSVDPVPVVFTAQSKLDFYCRDAVCAFVLDHGCVPINPFRLFEYFLGDRVDRNLIRRANNNLVRTCDELWVFGQIADGVLFEIEYAWGLGKPVRFFTISPNADEIRPLTRPEDLRFELIGIFKGGQSREDLLEREVFRALFAAQPEEEQVQLSLFDE